MSASVTRLPLLVSCPSFHRATKAVLLLAASATVGSASVALGASPEVVYGSLGADDLPDPVSAEQRSLRKAALEEELAGH